MTVVGGARTDIAIDGDRIVAKAPPNARVVDCTGLYVMPGLVDMHAHILWRGWDENGNFRPRWDRETVLQNLRLLLSFGVTTVRDPGAETEAAVKMRDMRPTGPRIFTAGRMINDSDFDPEPLVPVHDEAALKREIDWQAKAGVDLIKIYSSMPPHLTRIAIAEAHKRHLPVIGHLQRTTWTEAAEMGIDGVEHPAPWSPEYVRAEFRDRYQQNMFGRVFWLDHLDDAAIDAMVAALAKHRVNVDPTLMAIATKFFGDDPRWTKNPDLALAPKLYVAGWPKGSFTASWTPEQYREAHAAWPKLLALVKKIYDAGVPMTVGTDMPGPWIVPGASIHDEMTLLHDAGIPNAAILQMATRDAARALHRENDIGTIAPGMRADLVVLERDPLTDIRNTRSIRFVIHDGVVYEPAALRR